MLKLVSNLPMASFLSYKVETNDLLIMESSMVIYGFKRKGCCYLHKTL